MKKIDDPDVVLVDDDSCWDVFCTVPEKNCPHQVDKSKFWYGCRFASKLRSRYPYCVLTRYWESCDDQLHVFCEARVVTTCYGGDDG